MVARVWRIWGIGVLVCIASLSLVPSAGANYFGWRYLIQGDCCGGVDITGTRATLTTPNSNFATTPDLCAVHREVMEGNTVPPATGDNRLIQTGMLKCGNRREHRRHVQPEWEPHLLHGSVVEQRLPLYDARPGILLGIPQVLCLAAQQR